MKMKAFLVVLLVLPYGIAHGAETIEGTWQTETGETAIIKRCGSEDCIVAQTGIFAGKRLGTFSKSDGVYTGHLTDPKTNVMYNGTLMLNGDNLKLRGCATTVLCKTQTWTRKN